MLVTGVLTGSAVGPIHELMINCSYFHFILLGGYKCNDSHMVSPTRHNLMIDNDATFLYSHAGKGGWRVCLTKCYQLARHGGRIVGLLKPPHIYCVGLYDFVNSTLKQD